MQQAQKEIFKENLVIKSKELLGLLASNILQFKTFLTSNSSKVGIYSSVPILHLISVSELADTFLKLSAQNQQDALLCLYYRHKNFGSLLQEEQTWVRELEIKLLEKAKDQSQFIKWRLNKNLNFSIRKSIGKWDTIVK